MPLARTALSIYTLLSYRSETSAGTNTQNTQINTQQLFADEEHCLTNKESINSIRMTTNSTVFTLLQSYVLCNYFVACLVRVTMAKDRI